MERNIKNNSLEIENCEKQLQLSNYEDIKAELDYCIERLKELPEEIENEIIKEVQLNEKLEVLKTDRVKLQEILKKVLKDVMLLKAGFVDECKLAYVDTGDARSGLLFTAAMDREANGEQEPTEISNKDLKYMAENMTQKYGMYEGKPQNEYLQEVQTKFHENLSEMSEYKLQLNTKFTSYWVKNMNSLMDSMDTSSGLKLNLKWKNKKSESEQ